MKRFFRLKVTPLEWSLLIFGLIGLDSYVWMNTSAVVYQAYTSWAFDQQLRGLEPTVPNFIAAELGRPYSAASIKRAKPAGEPGHAVVSPPPRWNGRLRIPRLRMTAMVEEGADEAVLSHAVGHIPGTGLPGYMGNVALAAHRDTFFRPLRNIRSGDLIELETNSGSYAYLVQSTQIVDPRDVAVLNASGGETLTLVTCYPFYFVGSAPKRFIVHAIRAETNPPRRQQRGS
jgi:sortase A